MKRTLVLVSLVIARFAAAQPAPGPEAGEPPPPAPTPPPPAPTPPPPPPPMHHVLDAQPMAGPDRPDGLSFAIGVGYEFMTSLETPNIISVRLRLPTGLTFEPLFKVENDSTTTQTTPAPSATTSTTELAIGSLVRYPVIRHGRADFEILGEALIDTQKVDPDGPNNDSRTTTLSLSWGIGIGFWLTQHWQLSFTATNPLISYVKNSQDEGAGMTQSTSTTDFGLVFDPTVAVMIHLYN